MDENLSEAIGLSFSLVDVGRNFQSCKFTTYTIGGFIAMAAKDIMKKLEQPNGDIQPWASGAWEIAEALETFGKDILIEIDSDEDGELTKPLKLAAGLCILTLAKELEARLAAIQRNRK